MFQGTGGKTNLERRLFFVGVLLANMICMIQEVVELMFKSTLLRDQEVDNSTAHLRLNGRNRSRPGKG